MYFVNSYDQAHISRQTFYGAVLSAKVSGSEGFVSQISVSAFKASVFKNTKSASVSAAEKIKGQERY